MPVSALGKFTAISSDETGFVRGQAVAFSYYPTFLTPWFGGGLVLAFLTWVMWKVRRSLNAAKLAVLIPGVASAVVLLIAGMDNYPVAVLLPRVASALALLITGMDDYVVSFIAIPFEMVTVTFLLWRLVRVRNRLLASVLALGHGIGVIGVNLLVEFRHMGFSTFIDMIGVEFLLIGVVVAAPIAGPRLLMKGRATRKRFIIGLGLGFLLTLAALAVGAAVEGSGEIWLGIILFIPGGLLFSVLLKWNSWARDVATGEMFRRGALPE